MHGMQPTQNLSVQGERVMHLLRPCQLSAFTSELTVPTQQRFCPGHCSICLISSCVQASWRGPQILCRLQFLLCVLCSLQMPPSEYKGTQLPVVRPRRHVMPLQSEAPGLQVLQELPPIGTALPVVMDAAAVPSTGLPQVGDWVKVKVVGVAAVQVRYTGLCQPQVMCDACSTHPSACFAGSWLGVVPAGV